jgi:para-aminobenzoate synthetase component 1
MFPGGSISGAPKIRAMEIIDEAEPAARGVYTGSIGFIGIDGSACLNIAIRTIIIRGRKAFAQTGGGIVADSDPQAEWEETITKARALLAGIRSVTCNMYRARHSTKYG